MNTITNNVSFGAKLDYSNIAGNKAKWGEIAKAFEEKTKKYPNDTFYLNLSIDPNSTQTIETFPVKKAVAALKKIFSIHNKAENMINDFEKFVGKYNFYEEKPYGRKINKFNDQFCLLKDAYIKDQIKNDKVLSTLDNLHIRTSLDPYSDGKRPIYISQSMSIVK